MWIFPINMEGFAGENLGSSLFHLYSCEFSLEHFLFYSLSGQGPDSGSYSISFAPWGSRVQRAESHMTPGHVSVSHWRCHLIPLGPDQLRPQWSCSFPASRVKYGRPCHRRCAHKTYFQDEWKWSPFFLLYPFLFVSSASLFLIFFLIISLNFSNSLLYLTYIYMSTGMIKAPIGRKTHHSTIFSKLC